MPLIIAFIAVFVVGGIVGGVITHWKDGAKIERLTSSNAVLEEANTRCATDIAEARKSIAAVTAAAAVREKAAEVSMVVASKTADVHTAKARQIKALPPVQLDMQCEAIRMEQIEYVGSRASNE